MTPREPGFTIPWSFFLPLEQGGDPLWPRGERPLTELEAYVYFVQAATRQPEGRVFARGSVRVALAFGETPPLAVRYLQGAFGWGSKDRVQRVIRDFTAAGRIQVRQHTTIGDTYAVAALALTPPTQDRTQDAPQDADKDRDAPQDTRKDARKDTQPVAVAGVVLPHEDAEQDGKQDGVADASRDEHVGTTTTPLTPRRRGGRGRAKVAEVDPVFEAAWAAYPRRTPRSSLAKSRRAWAKTLEAGNDPAEMLAAVHALAARVRRDGKEGTGFFAMFSTLFGPDQTWRDELADAGAQTPAAAGGFGIDTTGMEFD